MKTYKKVFLNLGIVIGLSLSVVGVSYAVSGGDTYFTQRDPTNTTQQITFLPLPVNPSVITLDPSTNLPVYTAFNTGLSFNNVNDTLSVANVPEASVTNLVSDLASKIPLIAYEGTTQRTNAFPIFKSVTVASGVGVVNFTNDGTSTGTSLCTNGIIQDSVNVTVSDATASYQMAWLFSNSNKTLTVTTNKLTTSNILTGILGQAAANGAVLKVSAWCY